MLASWIILTSLPPSPIARVKYPTDFRIATSCRNANNVILTN